MAQPSRRTFTTPMTSRGFSSADVVVREGFICPICMQDLGSIDDLQDHFESDHAEEDRTLLQQLKGIPDLHSTLPYAVLWEPTTGYASQVWC